MLYLTCNCISYRLQHNASGGSYELNFDGLKTQKWNIPMNRAQRVDEKNGPICLVMFASGAWSLKFHK